MIIEQLILVITRASLLSSSNALSVDHSLETQIESDIIKKVVEAQTVYVMEKEQMKIKSGTNIFRKVLLLAFLWIGENSRTKMADMNILFDGLVEVGFVKEI